MNILKLINIGSDKLKAKYIFSHKLDSEILLSEILHKKREELLVSLDETVNIKKSRKFKKLFLDDFPRSLLLIF